MVASSVVFRPPVVAAGAANRGAGRRRGASATAAAAWPVGRRGCYVGGRTLAAAVGTKGISLGVVGRRRHGGTGRGEVAASTAAAASSAGGLSSDGSDNEASASEVSRRRAKEVEDEVEADAASVDASYKADNIFAAIWKFVRPHTIRGTILGTTAIVTRCLLANPELFTLALVPRALLGLVALLCGNGYIVGINQIYDVDIDKVNKPFLPIAAGELSIPLAWAACGVFAALGAGIVFTNFGSLITKLYCLGLFLGTIYSVPPLRLKRSAVAAFLIIATVRGLLLNFGVHHATTAAIGLPFVWSPPILFITAFVTVFAVVISITKDLADIEGDKKFNIETFATRLGVKGVSYLGSGLLLANYAFAAGVAMYKAAWFNQPLMVGAHCLFAVFLVVKTRALETEGFTKAAVQRYYQNIWYLFYSEYLLLPFI